MKSKKIIEHFKTMKPENWIIVTVEFAIAILFLICDIFFFRDLSQGVAFLGEGKHAYEVSVAIVVLLLFIMMVFLVIYDLFFRNYVKERSNIVPKEIHDGKVISIPGNAEDDKDTQPEEKK